MIKWLALLLILANGAFWAWTQGWLGAAWPPPGARQREPERLQQQVRPESIVVLSPRAASAVLEQAAAATAAASAAAIATTEDGAEGGPAGAAAGARVSPAAPAASAAPRAPVGRAR